jgi:hypothetical protein
MLIFKRIILASLVIMTGFSCQNRDGKKLEPIELQQSQLDAINKAIDNYNDKKLSRIIEIRDYQRQIKLFCIHQTVQIRKEPEPSKIINIIAKLYCAEADPKGEIDSAKSSPYNNLSNLSLMPVRYLLVEDDNGSFFVSTYELPRQLPYYKEDVPALFSKEERDEIDNAKLSGEEIGNRLRQKIAADGKSQPKS